MRTPARKKLTHRPPKMARMSRRNMSKIPFVSSRDVEWGGSGSRWEEVRGRGDVISGMVDAVLCGYCGVEMRKILSR